LVEFEILALQLEVAPTTTATGLRVESITDSFP